MAFSLISRADFSQSAECLPIDARGRQCVPSCLIFLLMANGQKSCYDIDTEGLNDILFDGSHLYCAMMESNPRIGLIDPTTLPQRVSYKGKLLFVKNKELLTGFLHENPLADNLTYHTLENAFLKACISGKNFIIVFNGMSIAVRYDSYHFYVFDSHSRNEQGLSCPDGKSVLGRVTSLQNLCSFLRSLSASICQHTDTVQFDLHSLNIQKKHIPTTFEIQILDHRAGFNVKTLQKRKKPQTKSSEMQMKRQKIAGLMRGRSLSQYIDDMHVNFNEIESPITEESVELDAMLNREFSNNSPGNKDVIQLFEKLVSFGPDYVCSCCTQTFFETSVRKVQKMRKEKIELISKFLSQTRSVGNVEWICQSCSDSASRGKTPKFWVNNGLKFPVQPEVLKLSNLEERLISPRLPFMQLREMPRGGQINLRGNIVNVPADVNGTIKSLPRMIDENETIMLKLKRKLSYKHHVAFENVRPNKVFDAAKWLVGNSTLFKNEGIIVNESWLQHSHTLSTIPDQTVQEEDTADKSSDEWTEDDSFAHRPTGNLDTCLQSVDFREFNQILSVAPGEKNSPIGLYQDFHSEVLSFPTIFCGKKRAENSERVVPLHYSDVCKWELRNVDRRVAMCIPNIFFKLKRLQIKQIQDKVSLAIRKCKSKEMAFTVGDILSPGFVDKVTMQNDGYRVLRTLRGSPPYWEAAKRDVFAMIRQLGIPTWFCSFSAAETKWVPLLKSLARLVQGRELSTDEVNCLSWQEKCLLIKSDPVTCARYFDRRVQIFIKHVLKHNSQPIGGILDFFYRVEFQQRGSPHIHMVIWVKGAPVHGLSSDSEIAAFVDKFVTCRKDENIPVLVNYQSHRHATTCRKHGQAICRFNFPIPPMPETVVLQPLDKAEKNTQLTKYYEKVISCLNDKHYSEQDMLFEDFLALLDMTYETYIKAICSTLTRPKIFLKRTVAESRVNNYNSLLLNCWQANMDIQYVLDPYSCVSYIVSYISKGQRGLSNLLRDACNEARETDSDVRQQVRRIGNQFLSSVEIGAQEAVYLVLQMPLRRCTRDVLYVDTKRPDERTSLLKPLSELKDLPATSRNVEMDNVLKRYKRRPKCLENLCYASFASWYDLCKRKNLATDECSTEGELPETQYEHDKDDDLQDMNADSGGKVVKFACGTQVRKRTKSKVIYSHVTPINDDREEHFREKIMLYTCWRDDNNDFITGFQTFEDSYMAKAKTIRANMSQYEKTDAAFYESILTNLEEAQTASAIHPEAQHQELIDLEEGSARSVTLDCFDPGVGSNEQEDYDLGDDLGISRRRVCSDVLPQREIDTEQYLKSVRNLNTEQKHFFYHILHKVKTKSLPFYTFLSGGAGCGKSVLIRALYQALLKYFNHARHEDPGTVKLLLCAPTGKAAHNIGGNTIHSAFCIPASQGFQFKPLDMQQLNTMRAHMHDLKIVIIDEISMVGRGMLNFINLRLQEVKGCTKPFGGVSILAVGDLYQLKPVLDSWVFSQVYRSTQLQGIGTNLWIDLFDFYELKEVMRQKDDYDFACLLNRLREGNHTDDDLEVLKSRNILNLNVDSYIIRHLPHLFCRRVDANCHNLSVLSDIPVSDVIEIDAIDTVSGDLERGLNEKIISQIPVDPNKTMGLQKKLVLGIGMASELCSNIDTADGLTNGASCFIRRFDFRVKNSNRCSIIWVEFNEKYTGYNWRIKYKHLYQEGIPSNWTPVMEICRKFTYQFHKTYLIVRRQFPLYLAAGKTIHKAQGSTIPGAVIHFGTRKIDHVHYVGLSRVTSLSGVHILELNSSKITVSIDVEVEMDRLRTQRQIKEHLPNFNRSFDGEVKICFQNCRSLRQHIEDIKHEQNLLCADVIGFVETRVSGMLPQEYKIGGFNERSTDFEQSAHGIVVYQRENTDARHFTMETSFGVEYTLFNFGEDVVICFVYCRPRHANISNINNFLFRVKSHVAEKHTLIMMGDFNFDAAENLTLRQLFRDILGVTQLIDTVTTDYDSCLDHIYTNVPSRRLKSFGVMESYYSDHKPIYLTFTQN